MHHDAFLKSGLQFIVAGKSDLFPTACRGAGSDLVLNGSAAATTTRASRRRRRLAVCREGAGNLREGVDLVRIHVEVDAAQLQLDLIQGPRKTEFVGL